jgi:hypothetical protein
MKINSFLMASAVVALSLYSCAQKSENKEAEAEATEVVAVEAAPNTLTADETTEGWQLLFDGQTTDGWRSYGKSTFPSDWQAQDGNLYMAASGRGEAGSENGGDILYDKKFSNFHLKLEWKISPGGNSGIFYLGQETPELDFIWKTAPEMQVLDNEKHPDALLGTNGNRKAGSLYDLYPANPQNAKPVGEWNQVEIICYNGTVVHKQNGEVVVEYHLWTPQWEEDVAASKFPSLNPDWAKVAKEGYFGLQDHGDDVWFRNIKIREM